MCVANSDKIEILFELDIFPQHFQLPLLNGRTINWASLPPWSSSWHGIKTTLNPNPNCLEILNLFFAGANEGTKPDSGIMTKGYAIQGKTLDKFLSGCQKNWFYEEEGGI
jgi:hypothetical protein